jgi:peptide deformylase
MLAIDVDYGDEESRFFYGVINPKIIASSVQMTYLEGGEGCLSDANKRVNVLRHNRVKVKATFYDPLKDTFEEIVITLRSYKAVVIQHEMDHLDGTLFIDKLAKSTSGIEPCEFI